MTTGDPSPSSAADDDLAGLRAERDALAAERNVLRREGDALRAELADATASVIHWRAAALHRWEASAAGTVSSDVARELDAMRNTLSWRVTKPLRAVRSRMPGPPDG